MSQMNRIHACSKYGHNLKDGKCLNCPYVEIKEKCMIHGCTGLAVQPYDMYSDKPHSFTIWVCAEHGKQADKHLEEIGKKVKPDGTYEGCETMNRMTKNMVDILRNRGFNYNIDIDQARAQWKYDKDFAVQILENTVWEKLPQLCKYQKNCDMLLHSIFIEGWNLIKWPEVAKELFSGDRILEPHVGLIANHMCSEIPPKPILECVVSPDVSGNSAGHYTEVDL